MGHVGRVAMLVENRTRILFFPSLNQRKCNTVSSRLFYFLQFLECLGFSYRTFIDLGRVELWQILFLKVFCLQYITHTHTHRIIEIPNKHLSDDLDKLTCVDFDEYDSIAILSA